VLPLTLHPQLGTIRSTNHFILERMASTLHRWEPGTVFLGTSDLAIDGRKISGNAQRRKRNALLFHGTILYAMQGTLIARYLKQPARQPEYREDRPHGAFLRTIDAPSLHLKRAIAAGWGADRPLDVWPEGRLAEGIRNVRRRSEEHMPGAEVPFGLAAS
jgi:lipoate-protein ligase A